MEISLQNVEKCKNTLFWNTIVFAMAKKNCVANALKDMAQ